jgi:ABC-type antimicrobial peptide transport system permease subunit
MVLGRGSRLLLAGTAIGLIGSLAAGRWLAAQVWRVPAFDPVAFTATSLLLLVVGSLACYWPARRAARIDPVTVIRGDV